MRLIDADSLETHEIYEGEWVRVVYADDIDNAPTVDAEPVRHGRWEYVKKRLARGGYVDASECSVCHKIIMPHVKLNYCPNCGAKMGGDSE